MELVHELLEGITHSDSRLWRTLTTLWFKPGKLTEEFVAGRRVAYLPPFRLYLILSIVFFLLASFVHTRGDVMNFDEAFKPGGRPASASAPTANRITSCKDFNFIAFSQQPRLERAHPARLRGHRARQRRELAAAWPSVRCQKRCSSFCR